MFWEHGTIFATAMTPVIVALVSEGLRKPVQHVSAVAPRVARRSGTGAAVRRFEPAAAAHPRSGAGRRARRGAGELRPAARAPARRRAVGVRDDDPFGLRKARRTPRPRLKIALITGALAFVIAAGVVTASELALFGGSVSSDRRTSLFGGEKTASTTRRTRPTPTPTATPEDGATPDPDGDRDARRRAQRRRRPRRPPPRRCSRAAAPTPAPTP